MSATPLQVHARYHDRDTSGSHIKRCQKKLRAAINAAKDPKAISKRELAEEVKLLYR